MKIEGRVNTNFFASQVFKVGQQLPMMHDGRVIGQSTITQVEGTYYMYEAEVLPEQTAYVRDLILGRKVPRYVMTSRDMPHTKETQMRFVIERLVDAVNGALVNDPDCLGGDILCERKTKTARWKCHKHGGFVHKNERACKLYRRRKSNEDRGSN